MTTIPIPRWRLFTRFALQHEAQHLDRRIDEAEDLLEHRHDALNEAEWDDYKALRIRREEIRALLS